MIPSLLSNQFCIVMDDGRIVADGMTQEILEDETFLREHGLEKP